MTASTRNRPACLIAEPITGIRSQWRTVRSDPHQEVDSQPLPNLLDPNNIFRLNLCSNFGSSCYSLKTDRKCGEVSCVTPFPQLRPTRRTTWQQANRSYFQASPQRNMQR